MTKIEPVSLVIGVILLSQTMVGVMGNFFLLYHYLFIYHTKSKLRCIELILKHILIANSLLILSTGLPQTMVAFGLKNSLNDFVCKIIFYVERVGRGMSIGTICLLSIFQTVTISPMNACCKDLKIKAPKYVEFSIYLCWFVHMVVNFIFPLYLLYVSGRLSSKNITKERKIRFCTHTDLGTILGPIYVVLVAFPEVACSVLMISASSYMIFTLYQHKQRVQHIHRTNVFFRSPESRATKSILLLVGTFVSFYSLSSLFNISIALFPQAYGRLVIISDIVSVCFPTISPFLLISQDSSISRPCLIWIRNALSIYKK
ncbi:vomeronasal 1 receptor cavPorV1R638 [Cavia porcellus]|uniref:vomeronasal 1 receptor cavPorV1R638 n=1 Tax=Cavia porcellus TaxID=10141 RepID=UPI0001CF741B|nr:vomeronasal 1 receptor cavPorV1R638 [Cavia porcellus]